MLCPVCSIYAQQALVCVYRVLYLQHAVIVRQQACHEACAGR